MINKKLLLALSVILMISLFAFAAVGAENVAESVEQVAVDELVIFDGYSARMVKFNGLRSQYTLDTDMLLSLEESYNLHPLCSHIKGCLVFL